MRKKRREPDETVVEKHLRLQSISLLIVLRWKRLRRVRFLSLSRSSRGSPERLSSAPDEHGLLSRTLHANTSVFGKGSIEALNYCKIDIKIV